MTPEIERAVRLVLTLLSGEQPPTAQTILEKTHMVITMLHTAEGADLDPIRVAREVEALCNVYVPTAGLLTNPEDHVEWLDGKRGSIEWRFWERYERYLEEVEVLPPSVIRRLHEVTDGILRRLEDPTRPRRVGHTRHGRGSGAIRKDRELHRTDMQGGGTPASG